MGLDGILAETVQFIKKYEKELAVMIEPYQEMTEVDIVSMLIEMIDKKIKQKSKLTLDIIKQELQRECARYHYRNQNEENKNNIMEDKKPTRKKLTNLTLKEQLEYVNEAKQGNKLAKEILVKSHLNLIKRIARKYRNFGIPFDDLVQEGCYFLLKAINLYDSSKNCKFTTYSFSFIEFQMKGFINQRGLIYIPVHRVEETVKFSKVKSKLQGELGHAPSLEELAEKLNLDIKQIRDLEELAQYRELLNPLSLDATVGEQAITLGETIVDNTISSFEEKIEMQADINEALSTLKSREEMVLRLRFGLDDGRYKTLDEVGEIIGVSGECVRKITAKALCKLRNYDREKKLKDYL